MTHNVCAIGLMMCAMATAMVSSQGTDVTKPQLRRGIAVQLPTTMHAPAIPEADDENATVIAVTREGKTFVGVEPLDEAALAEKLRGKTHVYLKLDARLEFRRVAQVLNAVRVSGAHAALLTAQSSVARAGEIAPPTGLELSFKPESGSTKVSPANHETMQQVAKDLENASGTAFLAF